MARAACRLCGTIYALLLAGLLVDAQLRRAAGTAAGVRLATSVFDVAINAEAAQLELRNGSR